MVVFGWMTLFDSLAYYTLEEAPTNIVVKDKFYSIKPEPRLICPADTSIIIPMPALNKTFTCGNQEFKLKVGKILIWVD